MIIEVRSAEAMQQLGEQIGSRCLGGEVIELVGDIGAGKTTFVKGLARALGVDEDVQSPTFTISRVYQSPQGILLAHYDFYRLSDPGVMKSELAESAHDDKTITVIEWAEIVSETLPDDTLRMHIESRADDGRTVTLTPGGSRSEHLVKEPS